MMVGMMIRSRHSVSGTEIIIPTHGLPRGLEVGTTPSGEVILGTMITSTTRVVPPPSTWCPWVTSLSYSAGSAAE